MRIPVSQAPSSTQLIITDILDENLQNWLRKLELYKGDAITRLPDDAVLRPVRVKCSAGEVVLAAGMSAKIVVRHDDGHTTPVIEMLPNESGEVVALTCGEGLRSGLDVLGIREKARLTILRKLPPMGYHTLIDGEMVYLSEGAAAKIWGEMDGRRMQYVTSARGKEFHVEQLLGGNRSNQVLVDMGIVPGKTIILHELAPASVVGRGGRAHLVLTGASGLRFYLRPDQAEKLLVRVDSSEKSA